MNKITKAEFKELIREVKKFLKEEEELKNKKEEQKQKQRQLKQRQNLIDEYLRMKKSKDFCERLIYEMLDIEYNFQTNKIDWFNNDIVENNLEEDSFLEICYHTDYDTFIKLVNCKNNILI